MKGLRNLKRVRIYMGERDKPDSGHEPLWEVILRMLRDQRASGATVFRGLAGFGVHSRIHMGRLADVLPDLPVVIEWIDDPARVERVLPRIGALVKHGTITIEDIELVRPTGAEDPASDELNDDESPT
ncbi:MAG TPA: DUF190 domain-containing protein [Chloroflexota bacterium]|nr:DUF190 domain-containing protein [Chloroflexota bacterium]